MRQRTPSQLEEGGGYSEVSLSATHKSSYFEASSPAGEELNGTGERVGVMVNTHLIGDSLKVTVWKHPKVTLEISVLNFGDSGANNSYVEGFQDRIVR